MAAIFKRNKKDRNEPYKIQYVDHLGKRCTVKGFTDKGLTEQLAARLEDEARMRVTGLIDPEMEQFNVNKGLPLEDHVQAFAQNLADNTDNYVDLILSRIRRTIKDGKFETFFDFTLDRVQALTAHPAFSMGNPNRVRSLIGAFAANQTQFNRPDGKGYEFVAERILALDPTNPLVLASIPRGQRLDVGTQSGATPFGLNCPSAGGSRRPGTSGAAHRRRRCRTPGPWRAAGGPTR